MRRYSLLRCRWAFAALLLVLAFTRPAHVAADPGAAAKMEPLARGRAALKSGVSRVIVRAVDSQSLSRIGPLVAQAGGRAGRHLSIINGQVATVPNAALNGLARNPFIAAISLDRQVSGTMERTGATVGATSVRQELGVDGTGVSVAIIDSGVTPAHDDLRGSDGSQRVEEFVDFVNGRVSAYDDYGHGSHVAGIIAGDGFDSSGARTGIAPGAGLVVLKALDASGHGRVSDVIAALDWAVDARARRNIRVINLSIAAGVNESYETDPLTVATKKAVSEGIVVVVAAGNAGQDSLGTTAYGGITAPANAPWVLTVGASSHMGTSDPSDDTMASFSSRGPTAVDIAAKPDLVAPGVGIESLSAPESALYTALAPYLLSGTVSTTFLPYLSLTGTSMSAPVVAGTVALMLEANPELTPNEVKAILQYTSRPNGQYDALTEGAGFLNAKGAVELAAYFSSNPDVTSYPDSSEWAQQIIWGNQLVSGGRLTRDASAWSSDVTWGAGSTPQGENITWGKICWTVACMTGQGEWTAWGMGVGAGFAENVVWGSTCGGSDCTGPWSPTVGATLSYSGATATTVVWGSSDGDTVVWGSTDGDTVVWGSLCSDLTCGPVLWNKQ